MSREDVVRVAVIQRSKDAGMSLDQVRALLDAESWGRHQVLEEHIADLDRRMAQMLISREMTLHALRCEAHDIAQCPRFKERVADLLTAFEGLRWDPAQPGAR